MPTDQTTSDTAPRKRGVSFWIKLLVFVHVFAITSWTLPIPANSDEKLTIDAPPIVDKPSATIVDKMSTRLNHVAGVARSIGRNISDGTLIYNNRFVKASPLQFYVLSTGFWQYWDMFSPNPASIDFYGTASITYQNGITKEYGYPRMYDESIPKKYVTERFRKFYERANQDADSFLWPFFAQRMALDHYTEPNNPPVKVVLTRHWLVVAPPGKPQQKEYNHYSYYTYTVDLEKLKKDAEGGIFG